MVTWKSLRRSEEASEEGGGSEAAGSLGNVCCLMTGKNVDGVLMAVT